MEDLSLKDVLEDIKSHSFWCRFRTTCLGLDMAGTVFLLRAPAILQWFLESGQKQLFMRSVERSNIAILWIIQFLPIVTSFVLDNGVQEPAACSDKKYLVLYRKQSWNGCLKNVEFWFDLWVQINGWRWFFTLDFRKVSPTIHCVWLILSGDSSSSHYVIAPRGCRVW